MVFQKLLNYWDFPSQLSLGFIEHHPKKRKYPVSGSQRRMSRLFLVDRKAKVTQITTNNQIMQMSISEHIMPCRRWATAAEEHTRRPSYQQQTGNWGYNSTGTKENTTTEARKNVAWSNDSKFLLQHLDGRARVWCINGVNHIDLSCPNWAYLNIIADHVYAFMTGVTAVSSRITQKSTNWFPKHYKESSVLKKPQISIQQAPLGYGETRHLCYGSKNFKECFQELF